MRSIVTGGRRVLSAVAVGVVALVVAAACGRAAPALDAPGPVSPSPATAAPTTAATHPPQAEPGLSSDPFARAGTPAAAAQPASDDARARPEGAADRYGVIVHTADRDDVAWFLAELGVEWYLHNDYRVDNIPPGRRKLLFVGRLPGPGLAELEHVAETAPGATWLILNEPNRLDGYPPHDAVEELHRLYTDIKSTDPDARILSPSILNWEFTCTLCQGYQRGSEWLAEFRAAYLDRYGVESPVDAWTINVYPLDWEHVPTVDLDLTIAQIEGLRSYLDGIPQLAGQPIWITEMGLHWGWEAVDLSGPPCVKPAGEYQTEQVVGYLRRLFDWLDSNGERLHIEKAFLYVSYRDVTRCNPDCYAGITLFDGPFPGAALTPAGAAFRERTTGCSP